MSKSIIMGKVFWIIRITLTAVVLLHATGCKKEEITGDIEYKVTHYPIVKASEATNITNTTATLNGTVITYGLSTTVTFEYGTTESYGDIAAACHIPATADSITYVSVNISGLTPCMPYHFRVSAENSLWKNFVSSDLAFIAAQIPVLTASVSGITDTTAILEGNIADDECAAVTMRGFFWTPYRGVLSMSNTSGRGFRGTLNGSGTGSYTHYLTGLKPSTIYWVQPFAITCKGRTKGKIISFITLSSGK